MERSRTTKTIRKYKELWNSRRPMFFVTLFLNMLKWMLLLVILVFTITPLIWVISSSFKTNYELFNSSFSLPQAFGFANYQKAIELDGLLQAFINTILAASLSTFFCILFSAMASYALGYKFRLQKMTYLGLIAGIYIPINAFMVPYFITINTIHLYNTLWALVLTYTAIGLPLSIIILKGYMDSIPMEMVEAATIDGCGFSKTFFQIIAPLSMPGMATIGIFQFVAAWNEFLYATLLTQDVYSRTLQVSIRFFTGTFVTDYAASFAMIVICIAPTILAYVLFQERIIAGLTSGALKA